MDTLGNYWRFARQLRGFLADRVTPERARGIVRERLETREARFLALARRAIFEHPGSPYRALLREVGCELGDLERMVGSDGLDATLGVLADQGVKVSVDVFKGRSGMTLGGRTFEFAAHDFDNPHTARHIMGSSSGSRGMGTRVFYDLDALAESWTVVIAIMLGELGAASVPFGFWYPIMPGAGPLLLLTYTKAGKTPSAWFSPVSQRGARPSLKSRIGNQGIVLAGRLFGWPWPQPRYTPLDEARLVARWVGDALQRHGGCIFNAYTSSIVRLCQAATAEGIDLTGARLLFGGEPLSDAKRAEIEATGAKPLNLYGMMDAGLFFPGCFAPDAPDVVHVARDAVAVVQRPREVAHAGLSVDALMYTSLLPTTPKVLLNVESGDYGVLRTSRCGCPWEALGYTTHLHGIRGFDKLTSAGMTFIGTDLMRLIEEVLPARFGGSSTDYQMVEEEDEQGHSRMTLRVSPSVGAVEEQEIVRLVLAELSRGPDYHRMMANVWAQSGTFRVVRQPPLTTSPGKLLPLHIATARQTADQRRP